MKFVANAVGESEVGIDLPLILPEEVIVIGDSVVVFAHYVIERRIGNAKQEVGKIHAGECSLAPFAIGEGVGAVVVRAVESERSNGLEVLDICAKFEGVVALGPDQRVVVLVRQRPGEAGQPVGIQALDIVEVHLRDAVVEQVLQSLPAFP